MSITIYGGSGGTSGAPQTVQPAVTEPHGAEIYKHDGRSVKEVKR